MLNRRVDIQPPLVALRRTVRQIEPQVAQVLITSGIFFVAGPQRDFVELQVLVACIAEDHGAEPPVADRQRLALPVLGRLIVVQGKALAGRNGSQGKGGQKCTRNKIHYIFYCAPFAASRWQSESTYDFPHQLVLPKRYTVLNCE